jgi:outer membrane lipoprotein SlyB
MKAVTGVFRSQADAERAAAAVQSAGVPTDKVVLLTPGNRQEEEKSLPLVASEKPGVGKALGAVLGTVVGMSGVPLIAAFLPGVGMITAAGLLGAALLTAAGATAGAVAGAKLENATSEGLPEDEIYVYEDALRKGRSVLVVMTEDESEANRVRELLNTEESESIDAAREQWWIGLRSAEQEHYSALNRNFTEDEKFYRLGFEAALHARTRCKEYDQVMGEMTATLEDVQRQYPGAKVEEPFTRGYERGRDYYQALCNQSKAA